MPDILSILSAEFIKWIGIAVVIASPVAAFFVKKWLQNFAYRVDINAGVFLAAFLITILVSFATMFYHLFKTARSNPVDSLRYE